MVVCSLHLDDPVLLRAPMVQPAHSFEATGTTNGLLLWCLHAND